MITICALVGSAIGLWRVDVPYAEIVSADAKLKFVVRKQWTAGLLPLMPGQGGDDAGWIYVVDRSSGKEIARQRVSMVNAALDELDPRFRSR